MSQYYRLRSMRKEMKKLLFGIALVFCAMSAPEAPADVNDSVKWIMADYIDNTADWWIHECNDALEKSGIARNMTTNECVQLMLDGLYLKHVWRVIGGDPHFANWAAQYYANLVLEAPTSYEITKSLTDDSENKKTLQKAMSDAATRDLLKNTILTLTASNFMKEKKIAIYRNVKKCLESICKALRMKGKRAEKIRLQSILLPAELINNIQANNRVLTHEDEFEAEVVDLPDEAEVTVPASGAVEDEPPTVDEHNNYSSDQVKWILADYIDNTADLWIHRCNKALQKYNDKLPENKKLTTNQCVQLMLDSLYLRHVWRVIGGDPYFANWAAQILVNNIRATLSSTIHKESLEQKIILPAPDFLKELKYESDSDHLKTKSEFVTLENTVLQTTGYADLDQKRKTIIRNIQKCLANIAEIITKPMDITLGLKKGFLESDNKFKAREASEKAKVETEIKMQLLKSLLPEDLIRNIQANHRLFKTQKQLDEEGRQGTDTPTTPIVTPGSPNVLTPGSTVTPNATPSGTGTPKGRSPQGGIFDPTTTPTAIRAQG